MTALDERPVVGSWTMPAGKHRQPMRPRSGFRFVTGKHERLSPSGATCARLHPEHAAAVLAEVVR